MSLLLLLHVHVHVYTHTHTHTHYIIIDTSSRMLSRQVSYQSFSLNHHKSHWSGSGVRKPKCLGNRHESRGKQPVANQSLINACKIWTRRRTSTCVVSVSVTNQAARGQLINKQWLKPKKTPLQSPRKWNRKWTLSFRPAMLTYHWPPRWPIRVETDCYCFAFWAFLFAILCMASSKKPCECHLSQRFSSCCSDCLRFDGTAVNMCHASDFERSVLLSL